MQASIASGVAHDEQEKRKRLSEEVTTLLKKKDEEVNDLVIQMHGKKKENDAGANQVAAAAGMKSFDGGSGTKRLRPTGVQKIAAESGDEMNAELDDSAETNHDSVITSASSPIGFVGVGQEGHAIRSVSK